MANEKWYWTLVSTMLLFAITTISYIYFAYIYGEGPQIEFITTFGMIFGIGSILRKMTNGNGNGNSNLNDGNTNK